MSVTKQCLIAILSTAASATAALAELPPVPAPNENPVTEAKRVLGKILFWDEQLSSDDSTACGTCHIPSSGGADPRLALHPGADGVFGGDDDVLGSPGVVRRDENGAAIDDPLFGFGPQVTGRAAQSYYLNGYAEDLFWDGRARSSFEDPLDPGTVLIANGGGLESQAVGPILSSVEMAHDGRTWTDVTTKLASVFPLRLAGNRPADVTAAIDAAPSYQDLFANAFGDPAITPARIAMAIATYERTLVPDQSPWDAFMAGDTNALTPAQRNGWDTFENRSRCGNCHTPPVFSDHVFRNVGLRPTAEDLGREAVTGNPGDAGAMKTPSLRNIGLRTTLMHTGRIVDVADALDFYAERGGHEHFTADQDGIPPDGADYDRAGVPGPLRADLIDFLSNGLTDPRVAAEQFPFDRPTLASELGDSVVPCDAAPRTGCKQPLFAGRSRLQILRDANPNRERVYWKWLKGEATTTGELGDPRDDAAMALCIYDRADTLVFEARTPAGDDWRALGSEGAPSGYKYKVSGGAPDGVTMLKIKAGEDGRAKIVLKARGESLADAPIGRASLPLLAPVSAQLQSATGTCFEVAYSGATTNDAREFRAD